MRRGVIHTARAEDVYPTLEPGSVSMVWSDGPFAIGKDTWDRMKPADLPAWYAPHIKAWGRICKPSASVYHWGTSDGWARVHPVYLEAGWTFRALIVWEKPNPPVLKNDPDALRTFPDVTEVCGFYQRCAASIENPQAYIDGHIINNPCRDFIRSEWLGRGLTSGEVDRVLNRNGMAGHYLGASQWALPTLEAFTKLAAHAQAKLGDHPDGRPAFVHPAVYPAGLRESYDHLRESYDHLRESYDHLREEYDHLREEYEARRVPFTLPMNTTNVWRDAVPAGDLRLDHPCQKPLAAVRRAILASTRVGDTILDPFAGTCRVALVCEQLHEDQARRHVSIEMDPGHVAAALKDIDKRSRQQPLF